MRNVSEPSQKTPTKPDSRSRGYDYKRLAQMVIVEGKPFYSSALEIGMPESAAITGPRFLARRSSLFAAAIREVSSIKPGANPAGLRNKVLNSLDWHLSDPNSPDNLKACEVAGKLKELDMFVRNTDVQIGVLAALGEMPQAIGDAAKAIPEEE